MPATRTGAPRKGRPAASDGALIRVRMLVTLRGPNVPSINPGEERDLPADLARQLLADGACEPVASPPVTVRETRSDAGLDLAV